MDGKQLGAVCTLLIERCRAGNSWPPDLAEFISLSAECAGGTFGFIASEVMAEYVRWRNESWRYNSAADYPWRHPVQYHICLEMRRRGVERQLTKPELEKLAGKLLASWEKKLAAGYSVPPIKKQIAAPAYPSGPTPAQLMHEKFLRRKAAAQSK